MDASTTSTLPTKAIKILLAALLCIACIPAQSFLFAKEAWAAWGDYYAVYYNNPDGDGYTLIASHFEKPSEGNSLGSPVKTVISSDWDLKQGKGIGDPNMNDSVTKVIVTGTIENCASWFKNMKALKCAQIKLSGTYFANAMFAGCSSLESFSLSLGSAPILSPTNKMIDFSYMFKDCSSLKSADLSSIQSYFNDQRPSGTFAELVGFSHIFENCSALETVLFPDKTMYSGGIWHFDSAYAGCTSLEYIVPPSLSDIVKGTNRISPEPRADETIYADCHSLQKIGGGQCFTQYLPTPNSAYIPGATGKWIKDAEGYLVPEILRNDIQSSWIAPIPDVTWIGSAATPPVYVVDNGRILTEGTDYVIKYCDNSKPGTASVVVSGRGKYTGSATKTFIILAATSDSSSNGGQGTGSGTGSGSSGGATPSSPIPVSPSDVTVGDADFAPGGLARPPITIVVGGITLREGVDYTVSYSGAGGLGAATVTITGKGAYRFSVTKTFQVRPKAPTIKKLSLTKKGFAVKWGKLAASQADGYQVRYATKKSMKGAKKLTAKGAKKASTKVAKMKLGKTYWAQVRTYKKSGGKTYYSAWSKAKSVSNPPATSIKKVKSAKRGFTVSWKKQSKKWAAGYQVRWSAKKSMKGAKKATVKGTKRSSLKVSKLKAGKKYYVQVRTYKRVGKKTYYSAWSTAKAVKTKR